MCMSYETHCNCGMGLAGFNFRDEIMSEKTISGLYCPQCSGTINFDPDTMLADNGWIIDYDMEIAQFEAQKLKTISRKLSPDFIFDEGYCTWRGVYPSDHIDSVAERSEIIKLAKTDPKKYLEEIKNLALNRMERLAKEGWRKAAESMLAV